MTTAIVRLAAGAAITAALALAPAAGASAAGRHGCGNSGNELGNGQYPPGQAGKAGVSNEQVQRGERQEAHVPDCTFDPGSEGEYGVASTFTRLGAFRATQTGSAAVSFVVPTGLAPETHDVVFRGIKNGRPATVRVGFTVVDASGDSGISGNSLGLPRTGQAFVPMVGTGLALIVVGGAVVAVVRRRRELRV